MKIGIGNDHAAVEMKMQIKEYLEGLGHEVVNYGVDTTESCNYPEIGERVGRAVADGEVECAVLICGTGVGISIAANKVNGVRAAVCSDITTAHLVKEHNNANIIAFGARIVGIETAKDIVKAYLDAEFLGGRHQTRIDMISDIEKGDLYTMVSRMGNVFEPGIIGKYPVIQEIKDLMEAHGALRAMMSGSGPTVFGIFDDKNKMKAAARILRSSHLAKTVFATEVFNCKD